MRESLDARRSRQLGVVLMAVAVLAAIVMSAPASAEDTTAELEIDAIALLASPVNDVLPDTVTTSFPPQVVCLLVPQTCAEGTEVIRDPVTGLLLEVDRNDDASPVHPVPPDSLAVSFLGGNMRYASAMRFAVPPVETELESFVLKLPQGQPSYSFDSPAFRQVVFEVVALAATQDPEVFVERLAKALGEQEPLGEPLLGIEACPLTVPVPPGAVPPQAESYSTIEAPTADGGAEAAVDCLYGSNGVFDGESQTWSFDLTFAAQAWRDGSLPNRGVLFRPVGAPNLAFGDPDTSTNIQVILDVSQPPKAAMSVAEPEPEPEQPTPTPQPTTTPAPTQTTPPANTGNAPSTVAPPSTGVVNPPPATRTQPDPVAEQPQVAPQPQASSPPQALDVVPVSSPQSMPMLWLLIPLFAAGAWLTARSLTTELVVAGSRPGALSRLVDPELQ